MAGYIKDHRKELDSDIWIMPPLYHRVWQYLKYKVNYEDADIPQPDGSTLTIRRGQHLTTLRDIAEGVSWMEGRAKKTPNPHTISKILDFMVRRNMIAIDDSEKSVRGNRKYTLISLINWDKYQIDDVTGNTVRHSEVTDCAQKKKNKEIIITPTVDERAAESMNLPDPLSEIPDDQPITPRTPYIDVLNAYCLLHNKIDINVRDDERSTMKGLLADMPADFIITTMQKVLVAKREREGESFDLPSTFTYYHKPILKAWKAEQGSQTDAQVPALPSVAPGYSPIRRDKQLDARKREIALNQWIDQGGDPAEFVYRNA